MKFYEIERKFLLNEASSRKRFFEMVTTLPGYKEVQTYTTTSHDLYLLIPAGLPFIYRFRHDVSLQQLTAKSLSDAFPVRREINLNLDPQENQRQAVLALFNTWGIAWQGELHKELTIFQFGDCEVVIYTARLGSETLHCIEIEALGAQSIAEGLAIIDRYQAALEVSAYARESSQSLFQLLMYPQLPLHLQRQVESYQPTS